MKPGKNKLVRNVEKCNAVDCRPAGEWLYFLTFKYEEIAFDYDSDGLWSKS